MRRIDATAAASALLLLAGCSSSQSARTPPPSSLRQIRADTYAAVGRRLYREEQAGAPAQHATRVIAELPQLARAVQLGDAAATKLVLLQQPVRHAVRARVVLGTRVLADVGLTFVIGGQVHSLLSPSGQQVGSIEVSIQDAIGYVRLMKRLCGVQVVVRGKPGQVATLLPAAANVPLPRSGQVTIAGRHYLTSSFTRRGFGGEPVTVWVLTSP